MDKTPLVEKQIEEGKLFISKLDEAKLDIKAAFWFYDETDSSWKLMIASSSEKLNANADANRTVTTIMHSIPNLSFISSNNVVIIPLDHPFIKNFKSSIETGPGIVSMRVSNNQFNHIYVEDMLIYRMNLS